MKTIIQTFLALLFSFPLFALTRNEKIDAIIQQYQENYQFQGAVLVAKDHHVEFVKGYGKANIPFKIDNQIDTKFLIGSLSKQFTAAAILKLQDENKLRVSDLVSKYLPVPNSWKEITLHHLLSHTATLKRDAPLVAQEYQRFHTLDKIFDSISKEDLLLHPPGEFYSYSNAGYSVLAYLIEKISGVDFDTYLVEHLLKPAHLNDTANFHPSLIIPNMSDGHVFVDGTLYKACCYDHSNVVGAGSIYSTAEDLNKWIDALTTEVVLSADSLHLMFSKQIKHSTQNWSYGYGWIIDEWEGHPVIWHNGSINGFNSDLSIFPDSNLTLIFLVNRSDAAGSWYLDKLRNEVAKLF